MTTVTSPSLSNVAIIGAGITGLACANRLVEHGVAVTVFDKARGPGGRMSTKRLDQAQLDLGAQAFTARDPAFRDAVADWLASGLVARWPIVSYQASPNGWQLHHDSRPRYTGAPRMSAITRHLAARFQAHPQTALQLATLIEALHRSPKGWQLQDAQGRGYGPFDHVVLTTPPPQALPLVAPWETTLAEACQAREQRSCWAAWAVLDGPLPTPPGSQSDWQMARIEHPALRLVSRNQTKPGREHQPESLSLMAHLDWSETHLEDDPQAVAESLWAAFTTLFPADTPLPLRVTSSAHRWRYAQPSTADDQLYLYSDSGLAMCGDSFTASRVESAWVSGTQSAQALIDRSVHNRASSSHSNK
ncbi:NAD(P)/FAD-dependent oxidoreductase [Vreelandella janggokensis]|uniref:FAD-dependent oxidoreductase n=1 Tax=Vreelandella janggokensis TaxID=370767 RepID=A0ABT4IYR9_9GAMM|nr:FAD-dependent oxidoreductase [Halomonas janggokensis]MCZ0928129.1 FAD-dependent oxidoreductase [Halomonas janggokensis]